MVADSSDARGDERVICRHCQTELPDDALFCGECGRAVMSLEVLDPLSDGPAPTPGRIAPPSLPSDSVELCQQCGAVLGGDDVFCPECGFLVTAARDTRAVEPIADVPDTGGHGVAEPATALIEVPEDVDRVPHPRRPAPDPFPWGTPPVVDLESTRLVGGPDPTDRFILQFSTGESVTASGVGLVGRNPAAQPGEFVDQLVTIFDAGKSVSKTHLEFGHEAGRFWVSDRYSTNGSIIRQPDDDARRCEPGRRYFVARGTRVDIGEQFFVVS